MYPTKHFLLLIRPLTVPRNSVQKDYEQNRLKKGKPCRSPTYTRNRDRGALSKAPQTPFHRTPRETWSITFSKYRKTHTYGLDEQTPTLQHPKECKVGPLFQEINHNVVPGSKVRLSDGLSSLVTRQRLSQGGWGVVLLENNFWGESRRAPGARLWAPTPGLATGWGPSDANPGWKAEIS